MAEVKNDGVHQNILENSKENRRIKVRWNYGLEPGYLVLYFAFNLTSAVLQNQLLKQMCLQLGYNITICSNLNTNDVTKAVEEEVQPHVANINSALLLLNSIFPALYSLLLGSWIDKFGRKKVLLKSYIGYGSTLGLITLISYISDNVTPLSPWLYLVAELPMCLLGGWPTLDIAVCCYVSDLSDEKDRSFRLGTLTFLNFLGSFSAYFSSSYILEATSTTIVFIISFVCAMSSFAFTIFFVDESIQVVQGVSACGQVKEVFSFARIKEIFSTLFKSRPFMERRIIWFLIAIITLAVFTMHGNGTVNYLFVREKFGWALREFTIFDSTNTAITVGGLFLGLVVLKRFFKISDMKLAILALLSAIIDSTFKAFATESYQLYLSSGLGVFRLLVTPVFRSIMSLIIPHDEIGRIYSATTAFEAFSGLGAGPLYSTVYNNTLKTFPGAFNLITSGAFLIGLILTLFVSRWRTAREPFVNHYEASYQG